MSEMPNTKCIPIAGDFACPVRSIPYFEKYGGKGQAEYLLCTLYLFAVEFIYLRYSVHSDPLVRPLGGFMLKFHFLSSKTGKLN